MKSKVIQLIFFSIAVILSIIAWQLGQWQISRAQEKIAIQRAFNAQSNLPEVVFNEQYKAHGDTNLNEDSRKNRVETFEKEWLYRPLIVKGNYLHDQSIYIDNVIQEGKAGVTVITPLLLPSINVIVLVERGWMPWPDRQISPADLIETASDEVSIQGQFKPIQKENVYIDNAVNLLTPNLVLQLNNALLEQRFRLSQLDYLPAVFVAKESTDGLLASASPLLEDKWVSRHKGYAFQWILLGLLIWVIYSIMVVRYFRRKKRLQNKLNNQ